MRYEALQSSISEPIRHIHVEVHAPTSQTIQLGTSIWQKNTFTGTNDIPNQISGPAVLLPGFASPSTDCPYLFDALTNHTGMVISFDHPETGITSTITPHDRPLNHDSWGNTASVVNRAIQTLDLQDVTLVGYSTGGAVALEAAVRDKLDADRGEHARRIKNLVLLAPASMLEMGSFDHMVAGVTDALLPYFMEYVEDLRKWKQSPFQKGTESDMTLQRLVENIQTITDLPIFPTNKMIYIAREVSEYVAKHIGADGFIEQLHRITQHDEASRVDPEYLGANPTLERNQFLVCRDTTSWARQTLYETPTLLYLFTDDHVVPPLKFLPKATQRLANLYVGNRRKQFIEDALVEYWKSHPLFPNNVDYTQSFIVQGHHITPRASKPQEVTEHVFSHLAH